MGTKRGRPKAGAAGARRRKFDASPSLSVEAYAAMAQQWRVTHDLLEAWGDVSAAATLVRLTVFVLSLRGYPITLSVLTKATGMPRITVSRALGDLRTRQLVAESIDPVDRRRRILTLTPAGIAERDRLSRDLAAITARVNEFKLAGVLAKDLSKEPEDLVARLAAA